MFRKSMVLGVIALAVITTAIVADEAKIVFVPGGIGDRDIFIMNADGVKQNITNNPKGYGFPRWSPDGKRILFSIKKESTNFDVGIVDVDGKNFRQITDSPVPEVSPEFSPDEKRIAFFSGGIIYVMNADGGVPWAITDRSLLLYSTGFGWSPAGDEIAFSAVKKQDGNVFVEIVAVNVDNPNLRRNITTGTWDVMLQWLDDGKIFFRSKRLDGFETKLFYYDPNDGQVKLFPPLANQDVTYVRWSRKGEKAIFIWKGKLGMVEEGRSVLLIEDGHDGLNADIFIPSTRPVSPRDRLATTWGAIKTK